MDSTECNPRKFQVGNHGLAETFVGSFLASDRDNMDRKVLIHLLPAPICSRFSDVRVQDTAAGLG